MIVHHENLQIENEALRARNATLEQVLTIMERQLATFVMELETTDRSFSHERTCHQQAQNNLRFSQCLLQAIVDGLPQAICWKDRHAVYMGCNRHFAQLVGASSPAAIIGKSDYDLAWPRTLADFLRQVDQQVLASNTLEQHRVALQLPSHDQDVWLETSRIPLHDTTGNTIGIMSIFTDITDPAQKRG